MNRNFSLKLYAFLCLVLAGSVTAYSQDSQTKSPTASTQTVSATQSDFAGTAAQVQTNNNVGNNTTDLANSITVSLAQKTPSEVLSLTNFGFTIPSSTTTEKVTVVGIEVTLDRRATTGGRIQTPVIQLIVDGARTGTNVGNTANIPIADETVTFGGSANLFGLTALTPEQVNSPAFGLALQFFNNSNGNGNNPTRVFLDFVSIKIFFTIEDLTTTPVNFTGLEGKKTSKGTELTWKVAAEVDVKTYEVERSANGNSGFAKIGSVPATGSSSYTFTDAASANGVVFYRIKNVDNDGKSKYSAVLSFRNGAGAVVFKVAPTVVVNKTSVQHGVSGGSAAIILSTADGKVVRNIRPAAGSIKTDVDMSNLRAGLYLLKWSDGSGAVETVKVVKQ